MPIVPVVAALAAAFLSAPAIGTETCAAQGVVLMQQRPGQLIPSQRQSPLQIALEQSQMALDQTASPSERSAALQRAIDQSQRALDRLASPATSLLQESPSAVISSGAPVPLDQSQAALEQRLATTSMALDQSATDPAPAAAQGTASAGTASAVMSSATTPAAPPASAVPVAAAPQQPPAGAVSHVEALPAQHAAAVPPLQQTAAASATQPQAAAVQATQGVAAAAQADKAQAVALKRRAASALAANETGDDKQEYDKAGYEKDFDTEWKEHRHSAYKIGTTTEAPRSGACARAVVAGVAAAVAGLALL